MLLFAIASSRKCLVKSTVLATVNIELVDADAKVVVTLCHARVMPGTERLLFSLTVFLNGLFYLKLCKYSSSVIQTFVPHAEPTNTIFDSETARMWEFNDSGESI